MSAVVFEGEEVALSTGESVLDALLREGHVIANGCRAGVCQSCVLGAEENSAIAGAQSGLSDAQKQLNYFLSCQCMPEDVIKVRRVDSAASRVEGRVVAKQRLNARIWLLRLKVDMEYLPGQYITLWRNETLARSYSIASLPNDDGIIECHIRHYAGGQFSSWVADEAQPGDTLGVQGPMGKCVYTGTAERPLLLAAIGTGLAPIWGVLQAALAQGHSASIDVVIGAKTVQDFYLLEQLQALADEHANVSLHFVCQQQLPAASSELLQQADIYHYCRQRFGDLKGYGVYLCGGPGFVSKMRKQSFLTGASMGDINADIFLPFGSA